MMLLLEDKLSEIKDELYIYGNFGCLDEEDCDYGEAIDTLWDELHHFTNISIFRGVSKAAIISENSSYVLKIPFNGEYVYTYNEEDGNEDEVFEKFYCANNSKNNWDYCRLELENYKEAEKAGLECFFARTLEYGTTPNGYPVYIQEKVTPDSGMWEEDRMDFNSEFLNYIRDNRHLLYAVYDVEWVASAIFHYGLEKFFKLLKFAKEHGYMFSDLHESNYGYRANGEPVILDFSGWFD